MGEQGRTILFSSHILEEVEQVSGTVQVIVAGRLAASGDFRTHPPADDHTGRTSSRSSPATTAGSRSR